jgi:hypothetical protein
MIVAAISPHRMRFTFPAFASCSWKNGLATVNQLSYGQNPANTPEASPTRRIKITARSLFPGSISGITSPGRCIASVLTLPFARRALSTAAVSVPIVGAAHATARMVPAVLGAVNGAMLAGGQRDKMGRVHAPLVSARVMNLPAGRDRPNFSLIDVAVEQLAPPVDADQGIAFGLDGPLPQNAIAHRCDQRGVVTCAIA